jgi:predicted dehydrogenase
MNCEPFRSDRLSAQVPVSRRRFLQRGGQAAAAAALCGVSIPHVHAAEDNTVRLALIGSGSRGSGAVANAFSTPDVPLRLHAMADIFEHRLGGSHRALSERFGDRVDVPPERRFLGFDAYRHAIDCLRPGDVALLTTHAAFRPTHLDHAVDKGVHVFMEKSFAPDPAGLKRMLRAGERAEAKNLKIAAGLMCRHSVARQALIERIRDGMLGDVSLVQAYRLGGGSPLPPRDPDRSELLWQIGLPGAWHFYWVSSGWYIEWLIHQIDECCWIKDDWPVSAQGLGGRQPLVRDCGQNLDSYSVEYRFADGSTALVSGRRVASCHEEFATYIHGARCAAQFSGSGHAADVHVFPDQRVGRKQAVWSAPPEPCSPWDAEWHVLLDAIRNDRPHNETRRAILANFAAILGRAAAHTGQVVTWDEALDSDFQFCDYVDQLHADSAPPVREGPDGQYPVPRAGMWSEL